MLEKETNYSSKITETDGSGIWNKLVCASVMYTIGQLQVQMVRSKQIHVYRDEINSESL